MNFTPVNRKLVEKALSSSAKQVIATSGIASTRSGSKELEHLVNHLADQPFPSLAAAVQLGEELGQRIVALSQQMGRTNLDQGVIRQLLLRKQLPTIDLSLQNPEPSQQQSVPTAKAVSSQNPAAQPAVEAGFAASTQTTVPAEETAETNIEKTSKKTEAEPEEPAVSEALPTSAVEAAASEATQPMETVEAEALDAADAADDAAEQSSEGAEDLADVAEDSEAEPVVASIAVSSEADPSKAEQKASPVEALAEASLPKAEVSVEEDEDEDEDEDEEDEESENTVDEIVEAVKVLAESNSDHVEEADIQNQLVDAAEDAAEDIAAELLEPDAALVDMTPTDIATGDDASEAAAIEAVESSDAAELMGAEPSELKPATKAKK
jgi:hypothetical protein